MLRAYLNETLLLTSNVVEKLDPRSQAAGSSITQQDAKRGDWCFFCIFNIRIHWDWDVGMPYVELDHFESKLYVGTNWGKILDDNDLLEHVLIVDSWKGDQPAGVYIDDRLATARLTRRGETVHLEMSISAKHIEPKERPDLASSICLAYQKIREECGKFLDRRRD